MRRGRLLAIAWIAGGMAGLVEASPVKIHAVQTPAGFLAGSLDGVRLEARGALGLAPEIVRLAELAEPFAYSLAALPDGWAVGTGPEGRVLKVDRQGTVSTLLDSAESDVFALWADPDGTLFAATSPDGRLYRIANGSATVWYEPQETYVWAIARGGDGALYLATGAEGRLHRVDGERRGTVVHDADEPHRRSLLPIAGRALLLGTAGEGRILQRSADGAVRTRYDSPLAEIVTLVAGEEGSVYAAALASEASLVDLAAKPAGDGAAGGGAAGEGAPAAAPGGEGEGEAPAVGSRPAGARGPRSEVVRLPRGGVGEVLWQAQDETVFSLLAEDGKLWIGTGGEGRTYRWQGDQAVLERDFAERQVVGLLGGDPGPLFLTTNGAALHRVAARLARRGEYVSAPLDAGQGARYGVFRWSGEAPAGSSVEVAFRVGDSALPDATWSAWSAPAAGREVALPELDPARYVQFRLTLAGDGESSPRVNGAELSYRQVNQRPKIERFAPLDPGQVLVPASFNPADQIYEPASPNRSGIFTTLQPALGRDDARLKTVWKRGMRTLRWKASDPNQDELEYALAVRREESERWLPVVEEWREEFYAFDSTALPDGRYRFRLSVSDRRGNPDEEPLVATQESEPVVLDQTPPERRPVARAGARLEAPVLDALSPLREAAISFDAGEWQPVAAADGLLDGLAESLVLPAVPAGTTTVLLRVGDAAFNYVTFDLSAEVKP